jgi:hypothetical protein
LGESNFHEQILSGVLFAKLAVRTPVLAPLERNTYLLKFWIVVEE